MGEWIGGGGAGGVRRASYGGQRKQMYAYDIIDGRKEDGYRPERRGNVAYMA